MIKTFTYFLLLFLVTGRASFGQTAEESLIAGKKLKAEGKCTLALESFKKAVALRNDFGEAYFEIGWCYNELLQHDLALEALKKANVYLPGDARVLDETGYAYYHLDSTDLALLYFRNALLVDSVNLSAKLGLGDIYRDKKHDVKEALKWYRDVLRLDKGNKKANYWAGWCCNELKYFSEAIPYLEKVVSIDTVYYLGFAELGYSLYATGKYQEALIHLKKAEKAEPRIETSLYYSGLCYIKTGQKQEAIKKYNELTLMESELAVGLLAEIQAMK
ncbi:MAG: tetratricopeptide repeat protein [Terrimonas sp.]|nr:tetratricopeptide repeat protein [Terrimonas sp.]